MVRPFCDFYSDLAFRLLLYPVFVWIIDVIWGALLYHGFNETRAWHYRGRWAYLNGFIRLDFYLPWIGLGALAELIFWIMTQL